MTHQVAQDLRLLAQQESRGAKVFRFSGDSLRGACDAGWSSAQIFEWLSRHSTTGIPSRSPTSSMTLPAATAASDRYATSCVRLDDPADAALFFNTLGRATGCGNWRPAYSRRPPNQRSCSSCFRNWDRPTVEDNSGRARTVPTELRAGRRSFGQPPGPGQRQPRQGRCSPETQPTQRPTNSRRPAVRRALCTSPTYRPTAVRPNVAEATGPGRGYGTRLTGRAHRWSAFRSPAFRRCGRCRHRRYRRQTRLRPVRPVTIRRSLVVGVCAVGGIFIWPLV